MQEAEYDNELILVVDDEPTMRFMLRSILEKAGYRIITAECGEDALDLASRLFPGVVLVDALMPGLDGFEVCRALKAQKSTSDIQVLMVTALSDIEDIDRGFQSGALDYIRKPFNPHELLIRTRNACLLRRSQQEQKHWRETVTRELYLAERLQNRLLSNVPIATGNFALNSAYLPSGGVSGDVFDRFQMDDGRIFMYMADVCGHGVAASLVSSLIKAIAGEIVKSQMYSFPYQICNEIDSKIRDMLSGDNIYTTAFFAVFDPARRRLLGLSCGHPSPIVVHSDGGSETPFSEYGGMPIGFPVLNDNPYSESDQVDFEIAEGDSVYIYTDGLFEAKSKDQIEDCGLENLSRIIENIQKDVCFSYRTAEILPERVASAGFDISTDDCSVMVLHSLASQYEAVEFEVQTDYQSVSDAGAKLENLLAERNWSDADAWRVRLLVIEYCNNIVEHSLAEQLVGFRLTIWILDKECIIRVVDCGMQIDFKKILEGAVMPDGLATSGRGLPIIREISDHVGYFRDCGENNAYFSIVRKERRDGGD